MGKAGKPVGRPVAHKGGKGSGGKGAGKGGNGGKGAPARTKPQQQPQQKQPQQQQKKKQLPPPMKKSKNSLNALMSPSAPTEPSSNSKLSALQERFSKKLEGARFRILNEKLYKVPGSEAFQDFQAEPELFEVYHSGYREQVKSWPENPLDRIIGWIRKSHPKAVVADMGCGDARLAASLPTHKVHSFDLVSTKPEVTACDIAHTPLGNASVDVVVFCLSLMGTNLVDFIKEAHRILKPRGHIAIAEVRSRFENEKNGIKKFMKILKSAGFDIVQREVDANTMFFEIECVKSDRSASFDTSFSAKACVYKKR